MTTMRKPPRLPSTNPGSTDFLWAAGVEDTFICQPDSRTGRSLDEYALTQHYEQFEPDFNLMATLGVTAARWGVPWYRVEPSPGVFDWTWTDRALDQLLDAHRIEPIVDLVHYGAPAWLEGSFFSPDYSARVASYAHAFAERYQGRCYWYTPLNEPRVHAWYAARLGWWPPYGRSWSAFARMLVALSRGIVETQRAIASVSPEARFFHVDATDLYRTSDSTLTEETETRQEIVFCALDLVQGRVSPGSRLASWLRKHAVPESEVEWFQSNSVRPDVVGYNMYPMFSEKHLVRTPGGVRARIRRCGAETFSTLTRLYADRYGLPLMCTETASNGLPAARVRWIEQSARAVDELRAEGVPLVGYTYWPLFSLVTWAYLRGALPPDRYLLHMGLWDLQASDQGDILERVETVAAQAYRTLCAGSVAPMGPLRSLTH